MKNSEKSFLNRHLGTNQNEIKKMLDIIQVNSLDTLIDQVVPASIRASEKNFVDQAHSELDFVDQFKNKMAKNKIYRSLLGQGFYDTITPAVIQRNILENPGWYTQYTPYQAEISQGRLEALLNFQTMTIDLTGLPIANASLLDEATACAEAMNMAFSLRKKPQARTFLVSDALHPQCRAVIETRARPLGIKVQDFNSEQFVPHDEVFAALFQYPDTWGTIDLDLTQKINKAHEIEALAIVSADPLALTFLKSPGEMNADIAVGSFQRFGVPMGYGGPHAAYMACKDEFKRNMPGRIVGLSKDSKNNPAIRLALQTREQHIRREKATSNICTAQVLLAVMSSMYAVYHGPEGLKKIALQMMAYTHALVQALKQKGYAVLSDFVFDTLTFDCKTQQDAEALQKKFLDKKINIRRNENRISISFDEKTNMKELLTVAELLGVQVDLEKQSTTWKTQFPLRATQYLTHSNFNSYHTEHEFLRYVTRLERKDLSLNHSMIPLGSCTMKLNATTEMLAVSWPEVSQLHPAAPTEQTQGYQELFKELEEILGKITGFDAVSLQPNAGSQGEYAGLLTIRAYFESKKQTQRNICLIPKSAHGTNPASAALAGFKIVVVECDLDGNIDLNDLNKKANEHKNELACLMVTYPSTHGVFETHIREICSLIHTQGGLVYLDGANMNAQIGLCYPGEFGADVCHLNLHKTFAIPHGGGGPGMGPIAVKSFLAPFLPTHPFNEKNASERNAEKSPYAVGAISAAPWGSASVLPISYAYLKLMGSSGLKMATEVAILNANYIAHQLNPYFPVLYRGQNNRVAHECIIDLRSCKTEAGIEVEDVAKRLMDYGFHAPTVSFPVAGTLMIEPTESESLQEIDRFIEAMINIHYEIEEIKQGKVDQKNNVLKNAPHTAEAVCSDSWDYPYTREKAAYPVKELRRNKFWPSVSRVDGVYGDRNLVCACAPIESYRNE